MGWHTLSAPQRRSRNFRDGPLAPYLAGGQYLSAEAVSSDVAPNGQQAVLAAYQLQKLADYRQALQAWFALVQIGGYLVIVVPHAFLYDRQLQLPFRRDPQQRRLYTPGSLMEEVEEALAPNSYRVRLLCDDDAGYDYADSGADELVGNSDLLLVLEKIASPAWSLDAPALIKADTPDFLFEPLRTRVEVAVTAQRRRILVLKLDHLGDFVIGLGALERIRSSFEDAHITLVVGSWNVSTAQEIGLADDVIAFDAFPRNSSEEMVDVRGKAALFRVAVTGRYDLAIDLRTDHDTRFLLTHVDAALRAGVGTKTQFPFLDIFLPIDLTRNEPETARDIPYVHTDFRSQGSVVRTRHRLISQPDQAQRDCAIVWGPYHHIRPGRYFFEPFLEIDPNDQGMLMLDIGLDAHRVVSAIVPGASDIRLPFTVEKYGTEFEFRIWTVDDHPSVGFSFYGGRLVRQGADSVLHQSEYLILLIELIVLRMDRTGVLVDLGAV